MSIFVDTGVFYAHHDVNAPRHDDAVAAFEAILDGEYGQPYTSDYVLDEAVTLTRKRLNSFEAADGIANRILGDGSYPSLVEVLYTGPDEVAAALETFRTYDDHSLSFTDAMTVALCERHGIDRVCSFDDDFDGIITRVEG